MQNNRFVAEKQAFEQYERLGGNYPIRAEAYGETLTGKGIGYAECPERGFVRVVGYKSGYRAAHCWNRFNGTPVYVGKAPEPKPKPEPNVVPRQFPPPPRVEKLESPEQRYFREHGNHPRAQDDVEIVMIKRGNGLNFGRWFFSK